MMLSTEHKKLLVEIARNSIKHGLEYGGPLTSLTHIPPALNQPGASFVTLEIHHQLRGCIGSLEAYRPLAEDVAQNAYNAAFHDPRFPPLQPAELAELSVQISVLTQPEPMSFTDEQDLLTQLVPGVDGVILEDGYHRATFLPQVWDQLPAPQLFMAHLKNKAGLPDNYWSPNLTIQRYQVEKFE